MWRDVEAILGPFAAINQDQSGFDITDRVDVVLCPGCADADLETAVASFKEYICAQTLARSLSIGPADGGVPVEWENGNMIIKVTR